MSTIAATNSLFEIDAELDGLLDEIEEQTTLGGEASDPVHFLAMRRAELLEACDEVLGGLPFLLGLLLDLIEEAVKFRIDLKERIRCCNR